MAVLVNGPAFYTRPGTLPAVWLVVVILTLALGLGSAKYAQACWRDVLHPGAVMGAGIELTSVGLGLVAATRYLVRSMDRVPPPSFTRTLFTLAILLVI